MGITTRDLIPRDAVRRLEALINTAPTRGELLGLSAQDLRQIERDTLRALNEINREFKLRGDQVFGLEDLGEFSTNFQEALQLALPPFLYRSTEVS